MDVFHLFSENPEASDHLRSVLDGHSPRSDFETEITTKAGKRGGLPLPSPPWVIYHPGFSRDPHRYHRLQDREEALRQSELRYKTVFNMAPDMFVIYDPEGVILDQNEGTYELFGIPTGRGGAQGGDDDHLVRRR